MLPRGTMFLDLDGTIFYHSTTKLLPGATEMIDILKKKNYEIIFVTRRGNREWEDHPIYNEDATRECLKDHELDNYRIVFNVMSPRHLMDDSIIEIHDLYTNQGFDEEFLADLRQKL